MATGDGMMRILHCLQTQAAELLVRVDFFRIRGAEGQS